MTGLETRASTAVASLRITHQQAGLMMAMFGPVCVAVWRTKPERDSFEVQRSHLATAVRENPGRALFLCVVTVDAPPPEQNLRDASSQMISGHGNKLAGCACVIEGSGFRAAITRTVLTGIALFIRSPSPLVFFESVALASFWLQKRASGENIQGLAEAIERARAGAAA